MARSGAGNGRHTPRSSAARIASTKLGRFKTQSKERHGQKHNTCTVWSDPGTADLSCLNLSTRGNYYVEVAYQCDAGKREVEFGSTARKPRPPVPARSSLSTEWDANPQTPRVSANLLS